MTLLRSIIRCCLLPKVLNMKAIHNQNKREEISRNSCCLLPKVLNMKAIHNCCFFFCCHNIVVVYYQRYWIWKQFTTGITVKRSFTWLLFITKGTEYESNSQLVIQAKGGQGGCCLLPKVLNMKAIHNLYLYCSTYW